MCLPGDLSEWILPHATNVGFAVDISGSSLPGIGRSAPIR
jgi:hypothetical protein